MTETVWPNRTLVWPWRRSRTPTWPNQTLYQLRSCCRQASAYPVEQTNCVGDHARWWITINVALKCYISHTTNLTLTLTKQLHTIWKICCLWQYELIETEWKRKTVEVQFSAKTSVGRDTACTVVTVLVILSRQTECSACALHVYAEWASFQQDHLPFSSTLSFILQLNITFVFPVFIFKPFASNPDFHFTVSHWLEAWGCKVFHQVTVMTMVQR